MVSKPVTLDSFVALAAQKGWSWILGYAPDSKQYQVTMEDPATEVEVNTYAFDATEAVQMAVDAMIRLPDGNQT